MSSSSTSWATRLLTIAAVMVVWMHLHQVAEIVAHSRGEDFGAAYVNAGFVRERVNLARVYAAGPLIETKTGHAFSISTLQYPPSAFLLFIPFTALPYAVAYRVWALVSVAALWLGMLLIGRAVWPDAPRGAALWLSVVVLTGLFHPVLQDVFAGQALSVVLCCHLLGLALLRRNHWAAGIWFALAAILKTHLHGLWLLCVVWRRWRVLAVGLLTTLLAEAISCWFVGLQTYQDYLALRWRDFHIGELYSSAFSSSLLSLLARLMDLRHHPAWVAPTAAGILLLTVAYVVWLTRRLWPWRRATQPPWVMAYGLWMGGLLLLSPRTHEHHLVPLLIPLVGGWLAMSEHPKLWRLWPRFLLAYGLLAAEYSTSSLPALQAGCLALLTAGRTVGMLLFLWWCSDLLPTDPPSPRPSRP